MIDIVHEAIDALERRDFPGGLNDDYERLRHDPDRWQQYLAERAEWDALG